MSFFANQQIPPKLKAKFQLMDTTTSLYKMTLFNSSTENICYLHHEAIRSIEKDTFLLTVAEQDSNQINHYSFEFLEFEDGVTSYSEYPAGEILLSMDSITFFIKIDRDKNKKIFELDYCEITNQDLKSNSNLNNLLWYQNHKFYQDQFVFH